MSLRQIIHRPRPHLAASGWITTAAAAVAILPAIACAQPTAAERADRLITATALYSHIQTIAHDSMMGRATPSRGLELTAAYIARQFQLFGLRPAGDSTGFVQRYPLRPRRQGESGPSPSAPNVVGIVDGSDLALRSEYIVFTAHMDHIGVGAPVNGDSIYNGADDDASGTAALIELARAFRTAGLLPRRSLIFLAVSGEERGLLGSEHFVSNPPVPVEKMVANVNLDMLGRNWRDTIAAIGKDHSDLGATLDRVAVQHPELGMKVVGDLWPLDRFFFRSDHFNFARRGVPAIFLFNGTHTDYHRPSDSPEKIDSEKLSRLTRLMFRFGLELANGAQRPRWNPESYEKIVEKVR
ncbi:MAG: M28 family metallopeptidase [Gemmatimonadota bacterium]